MCTVTPKRRGVRVDWITWDEDGSIEWSKPHSETIIRACRFLPLAFPHVAENTENISWIHENPSLFAAFQAIVANSDNVQNDVPGTIFFGGKNLVFMDAPIPVYQMLTALVQAIEPLDDRKKQQCYMTLRRACRKASKKFSQFAADQQLRQSIGTSLLGQST